MKIAYFDCFSGISGDMTIASFLDAGLSLDRLTEELKKLKISGYKLKKTTVMRSGISGTGFHCVLSDNAQRPITVKDIISRIDKSGLSVNVKKISRDIFINIGEAEAKIHGIGGWGGVHLHELGDIDSIVDIVGTAIALDELKIERVYASAINMGRTFVKVSHGTLPIPGPASLELLKGAPLKILDVEAELVTPTGAGLLKTVCRGYGRAPAMQISAIGYGAGTKDLPDMPNMLRVMIGETTQSFNKDRIFIIESNIDDMSPQGFEYLFERLFREGALDVYLTNIQMKKSRPAFMLTVLAEDGKLERLSSVIFAETTTIGLRFHEADRFKLERRSVKVKTRYGRVSVKVSSGPGGLNTASPEYEECARLARMKKVPFKLIYDEAKSAVRI